MKGMSNRFISSVYTPVKRETLTPLQFNGVLKTDPSMIKKSRFIPPTPSKKGFGVFEVEYVVPILKRKS